MSWLVPLLLRGLRWMREAFGQVSELFVFV